MTGGNKGNIRAEERMEQLAVKTLPHNVIWTGSACFKIQLIEVLPDHRQKGLDVDVELLLSPGLMLKSSSYPLSCHLFRTQCMVDGATILLFRQFRLTQIPLQQLSYAACPSRHVLLRQQAGHISLCLNITVMTGQYSSRLSRPRGKKLQKLSTPSTCWKSRATTRALYRSIPPA